MKLNAYQKTAITTVYATIFLILVGGIVRSTGSGMGCPDWPKCFGSWVPPTSVEELPSNYKDVFVEKRIRKNEKVVSYLQALGFDELAHKIENDPNIRKEEDFNATKTWIEYINRLVGALIGIFVFITFLQSFRYKNTKPSIIWWSFLAVFLTGFQGWLGSIVVSTNLLPGMITTHMVLAMVIVMVLIYAAFKATEEKIYISINPKVGTQLWNIGWVILILTSVQLIMGTQVREEIDLIKNMGEGLVPPRSTWIDQLGNIFEIHRTFSWTLVLSGLYLAYLVFAKAVSGLLKKLGVLNVALIFIQILIGIGIAYLNVPKILQVLHLTAVSIMISAQFFMLLLLKSRKG